MQFATCLLFPRCQRYNGTDGYAVTVTPCADECYVDPMIAAHVEVRQRCSLRLLLAGGARFTEGPLAGHWGASAHYEASAHLRVQSHSFCPTPFLRRPTCNPWPPPGTPSHTSSASSARTSASKSRR